MKFIAIDFETANSSRNSACEIGLVKVEDFKIKKKNNILLNLNRMILTISTQ